MQYSVKFQPTEILHRKQNNICSGIKWENNTVWFSKEKLWSLPFEKSESQMMLTCQLFTEISQQLLEKWIIKRCYEHKHSFSKTIINIRILTCCNMIVRLTRDIVWGSADGPGSSLCCSGPNSILPMALSCMSFPLSVSPCSVSFSNCHINSRHKGPKTQLHMSIALIYWLSFFLQAWRGSQELFYFSALLA